MSRPFELDALFRSLTALPGVGPRNAKLFEKLCGGPKVLDLLWHFPVDFIDRRFSPAIAEAPEGRVATMEVTVTNHIPNARRNQPYRVKVRDESGVMTLTFFHARKDWIEKQLTERENVIVSGKIEYYQGNPQMVHPDIAAVEERTSLETVEPIYPLTAGLTNKVVRKAMTGALGFVSKLPEWLEPEYKKRQKWDDWDVALASAHEPENMQALLSEHPARARLAYDELLANQLTLALVRHRQKRIGGRVYKCNSVLRGKLLEALPFALTRAQKRALTEIDKDMHAPTRMLRLLQGDVGSGKTVVAAMAMLSAVETGAQAAIMAPTEILARQHAESLKPLLEACGARFVILTGRDKGKTREVLLEQIANGPEKNGAQIVIGTHALFQEGVEFADLGLAVIDEQHRFGVHQRLMLTAKGRGTDVLVMTATPIDPEFAR